MWRISGMVSLRIGILFVRQFLVEQDLIVKGNLVSEIRYKRSRVQSSQVRGSSQIRTVYL